MSTAEADDSTKLVPRLREEADKLAERGSDLCHLLAQAADTIVRMRKQLRDAEQSVGGFERWSGKD